MFLKHQFSTKCSPSKHSLFKYRRKFSSFDHYHLQQSPKIQLSLKKIDSLRENWKESVERAGPSLIGNIFTKFKAFWTADSNAIEGSQLTRGETLLFLMRGLTIGGKTVKDHLDATNHAEAIEMLYEYVKEDRDVTEHFIKSLNFLVLGGQSWTKAIDGHGNVVRKLCTPGEYKSLPNSVLLGDGSMHHYCDPLQVTPQMEQLTEKIKELKNTLHPVEIASLAHYNLVRIHPFDDGNGRVARLLMNFVLLRNRYIPAIIPSEHKQREKYYDSLEAADKGNLEPFVNFVCDSLINTQEFLLEEVKSSMKQIN